MMVIENFEEKGLYEHRLDAKFLGGFHQGFYVTKDLQFFVRPSIWNADKWVIIPSSPEVAIRINLERFQGNEQEILNKLKEWKV